MINNSSLNEIQSHANQINADSLWKYYSYKLKTIIRILDPIGNTVEEISTLPDYSDAITSKINIPEIIKQQDVNNVPLIFSVNQHIVYSLIKATNCFILLGPMIVSANQKYHLNYEIELSENPTFFRAVPFNELLLDVVTIHNLYHSEIAGINIIRKNMRHSHSYNKVQIAYLNDTFNKREYHITDHSYYIEKQEQECIEHGDIERFMNIISNNISLETALLDRRTLPQIRVLCIKILTVSCRSAIRGGVVPEIAYTLEDSYIQHLDKMDSKVMLLNFAREAQSHYISLVQNAKKHKPRSENELDYRVEKCKAYIQSHLHDRITIALLAKEFHYNPDYLSHMFKQVEGIGLSEFIMNTKIRYTKERLIYTNDSYSKIASDLGFSSQSHLGKIFKLSTGMTLRKFRQSYQIPF